MPEQTFDSRGECEHQVRVRNSNGRYAWIWSTRGECHWCGTGRMWV